MNDYAMFDVLHLNGVNHFKAHTNGGRDLYYEPKEVRLFGITPNGHFVYAATEAYYHRLRSPETPMFVFSTPRYGSKCRDLMTGAEFIFFRALMMKHPELTPDRLGAEFRGQYDSIKKAAFGAFGGSIIGQAIAQSFQRGSEDVVWNHNNPFLTKEIDFDTPGAFEKLLEAETHPMLTGTVTGRYASTVKDLPPEPRTLKSKPFSMFNSFHSQSIISESTLKEMRDEMFKDIEASHGHVVAQGHDSIDIRFDSHENEKKFIETWQGRRRRFTGSDDAELSPYFGVSNPCVEVAINTFDCNRALPPHTDDSIMVASTPDANRRYNRLVDAIRKHADGIFSTEMDADLNWPELKELRLKGRSRMREEADGFTSGITFEEDKDNPMPKKYFIDVELLATDTTIHKAVEMLRGSMQQIAHRSVQ